MQYLITLTCVGGPARDIECHALATPSFSGGDAGRKVCDPEIPGVLVEETEARAGCVCVEQSDPVMLIPPLPTKPQALILLSQ